jgi:hypothetical protein
MQTDDSLFTEIVGGEEWRRALPRLWETLCFDIALRAPDAPSALRTIDSHLLENVL